MKEQHHIRMLINMPTMEECRGLEKAIKDKSIDTPLEIIHKMDGIGVIKYFERQDSKSPIHIVASKHSQYGIDGLELSREITKRFKRSPYPILFVMCERYFQSDVLDFCGAEQLIPEEAPDRIAEKIQELDSILCDPILRRKNYFSL